MREGTILDPDVRKLLRAALPLAVAVVATLVVLTACGGWPRIGDAETTDRVLMRAPAPVSIPDPSAGDGSVPSRIASSGDAR